MLTLVLGGARSGKSRFAESLCNGPRVGQRVAYIATLQPGDDEMRARIARHQSDRPAGWITVEAPLEIAAAVARLAPDYDFILLDCLTLWLSNLSWEHREDDGLQAAAAAEISRLIAAHEGTHLVVVSNEVGGGIVPETPLGRMFRDLQGWVNQDVARASSTVHYVVAGIPIMIKGKSV